MISFKHFTIVEYKPGMGELINYKTQKRRRLGESTGCCSICCDCEKTNAGQTCQCDPCNCCECDVNEALSFTQRRAKARVMKRIKAKLKMGQRKAKARTADLPRLKKRAKKQALNTLFKKFSKGKSRADIAPARRAEIEKRIKKMGSKVDRIAKKLLPQVRSAEKERKRNQSNANSK
jgi:hypothetical protein